MCEVFWVKKKVPELLQMVPINATVYLFSKFWYMSALHSFLLVLLAAPLAVDLAIFNTIPDLAKVILVKTFMSHGL